MTITLKNKNTGVIKQVSPGVNWLIVLVGFFGPLFRLDWKYFFIMLAVDAALVLLYPPVIVGFTIGMAITYNKLYIKDLIKQGFIPADDYSSKILADKNLYVAQ